MNANYQNICLIFTKRNNITSYNPKAKYINGDAFHLKSLFTMKKKLYQIRSQLQSIIQNKL